LVNGRIRLVRAAEDVSSEQQRAEETLRATARQQQAVAHLSQQALAGVPVAALMDEAVAIVARALDVEYVGLLEFRPESRSLLLRAGVGWADGCVRRTILPADGDHHGGYALRSSTPVVVQDLASDRRFAPAQLLIDHHVVSGVTVVIQGKERPFGIVGAHTTQQREFTVHDGHFIQAVAHVLATAIDRARTEDALRKSEEHFRSLIDNASDIVTILGEDGIFRYASPSVQRLLGYAPSELLERNVFELLHPDDLVAVADALARALGEPGTPHSAEFRFRHRDGSWRVLESVGQARVGQAGAMKFVVNSRDVTERRAQERALRASKERLRTVVAGAPLVLFALDQQGVFTLAEGRGLDALGVRPAQLVGQSVFQVYADLPQAMTDVRRALAGESFSSAVEVFGVVFEVWYSPIRDAAGSVSGVIGVANDITERRRAEEALRQSEESSRALVANATYGIYRSTPAGRFLAVNPALAKMLGYDSEAELLTLDLAQDVYVDPAVRDRVLASASASGPPREQEVEWKRKDGARILVRLSGRAVLGPDGAIESFETMAEDITARRVLEEQLRQSQKIEALGQLTGGIAHDFNNLLTIILANAELVRKTLGPEHPNEHADLRDLISAALRGRVMIKELLGFARRSNLDLEALDLNDVVSTLSGMLRRIVPADIEIVVAAAEDAPEFRADLHAVEQIVFNLATNARDAMPGGGVLRIDTRRAVPTEEQRVAAGAKAAPAWACLAVEDTGVGMDEATRQHIFEPFFTTKASGKGTGLGMATVHGLVKQHGGVIDVDSAPGRGTRIKVYFPAVAAGAPVAGDALEGGRTVHGGTETILVVEDEGDLRRVAKRILEQAGYQVLTAADGQEALEVLRQPPGPIHLVLSDLVMPRLGGRGLYDVVRREGNTTPFLFASGYSPGDDRGSLPPDLGVPLLYKPWTHDDVLTRVREILDRK
jgi:two-component system, cell cycle sensor histidine kinase and response regulator CckA